MPFGLLLVPLVFRLALRVVRWKLHAGLLRKVACHLGERLALDVHQERKDVARRLAPEAMVETPVRVHVERWRLLVVEGAEPSEAVATLFERHVVPDDLCDRGPVPDLSNLVFGNHRRVSTIIAALRSAQECMPRFVLGKRGLPL
jgi:hypothetical protein